ncbi:unnamed protein product [Prunus brigantina]
MHHEEDEFHATYSNDGKESVDCIHLDFDSESLDLLDHNEQIEELTRKFGDVPTLGMSFGKEQEAYQYYNSYARCLEAKLEKHPYFGDEHNEILDKHVSEDEDNLKL